MNIDTNTDSYFPKTGSDGPLGRAPEISIGASDAVLLVVSVVGFCVLAASVYTIVLAKLKTASELRAEEEAGEASYENRLVEADVSKLNRAQRRARARHIMKQKRKLPPQSIPDLDLPQPLLDAQQEQEQEQEQHQEQHQQQQQQRQQEEAIPQEWEAIPEFREDSHKHAGAALMSRKERQRAAKKLEVYERRRLEGDRRYEQQITQEIATEKRKERERLRALRATQEKTERLNRQKAEEREAYRTWKIFLEGGRNQESITVKEWISELKKEPIVFLRELADRFQMEQDSVAARIRELLDGSRISGILETVASSSDADAKAPASTATRFLYLSPKDMAELGAFVKSRDRFLSHGDFARRIEEQLRRQKDERVSSASE